MSVNIHMVIPSVTIVTGVNDTFEVDDGGGKDTCTIAAGTYYVLGTGSSDDLLFQLQSAVSGSGSTVTLSPTLEMQNTSNDNQGVNCLLEFSGNADITWGTFDGSDVGHTTDKSGSDSYNADTNPRGWFLPSFPAEIVETPYRAEGNQFHTVGGQTYTHDRSGQTFEDLVLQYSWIDEAQAKASENTSHPERTLQRCWARWRDGRRVRVYAPTYNVATGIPGSPADANLVGTYHLDAGHLNRLPLSRRAPGVPFYSTEALRFRQYVAK